MPPPFQLSALPSLTPIPTSCLSPLGPQSHSPTCVGIVHAWSHGRRQQAATSLLWMVEATRGAAWWCAGSTPKHRRWNATTSAAWVTIIEAAARKAGSSDQLRGLRRSLSPPVPPSPSPEEEEAVEKMKYGLGFELGYWAQFCDGDRF